MLRAAMLVAAALFVSTWGGVSCARRARPPVVDGCPRGWVCEYDTSGPRDCVCPE